MSYFNPSPFFTPASSSASASPFSKAGLAIVNDTYNAPVGASASASASPFSIAGFGMAPNNNNINITPADNFSKKTIEQLIAEKDTLFKITKKTSVTGDFEGIEYDLKSFIKLFDFFQLKYGEIVIPAGTLLFHSNHFFSEMLNKFEPIGSCMKIQDIRRYQNKSFDTFKYPFSQAMPRVYANFTPAGNMFVAGNYSVAESVYKTTEDLYFCQIPYLSGKGHLKDVFELQSSRIFKEYIEHKNSLGDKIYCGFILSTSVDRTGVDDVYATKIANKSKPITYTYPEILMIDGFDKCIKVVQYDLYKDYLKTEQTPEGIAKLIQNADDYGIARLDINYQRKVISSVIPFMAVNIGKFGDMDLIAYIEQK